MKINGHLGGQIWWIMFCLFFPANFALHSELVLRFYNNEEHKYILCCEQSYGK